MFRKLFFAFALTVLLLLSAYACAETFVFYVSADGSYGTDAVGLTYTSGKYYLFLPGQARLDNLRIGYSGNAGQAVVLNGNTIDVGESAACLKDENELRIGYKRIRFSVMQGSKDLPVLYITTQSGKLDRIHGNKKYKEPAYLVMTDGSGSEIYRGSLSYMKMRGNATTKYMKKNYQIKLENGKNLLGMGKAKKWILTGSWIDKSFLRNEISMDLARYMGIPYTPEHSQAELYVNHEYLGLYLFSEKVEINKNRIEVNELEKQTENLNTQDLSTYKKVYRTLSEGIKIKAFDIPSVPEEQSGGYLIEYEKLEGRYGAEASGFTTARGFMLVIKSPEYASVEQASYIARFMQGFENAIFSPDGIDPVSGKHYYEFVDKDSLVRKYLLNEFIKNYDGNSSSEFFFKPEDSMSTVAFAGPVWDLDNCFANYARDDNKKKLLTPEGFYIGGAPQDENWWPNLYAIPDFYDAVLRYYDGTFRTAAEILLGKQEDPSGVLHSLDEYGRAIEKSAEMNYARYPALPGITRNVQTGENLPENIEYIRSFIENRLAFLDREWIENDNEYNLLQFLVR